jgi:hypothetical protein
MEDLGGRDRLLGWAGKYPISNFQYPTSKVFRILKPWIFSFVFETLSMLTTRS